MASMSRSAPPPQRPAWRIEPERHLVLRDGRRVVLRPVAVEDADRMAEFIAGLTRREIYYFLDFDRETARRLALNVEQHPAFRLIALGDLDGQERILGYMFLEWADAGPPTYGACLRPGAQSSGLGRAMIDHLLTSAALSGVDRVLLTVHTDNWRALRLYQRAGFHLVGEFMNQAQGVKQYRMEADLRVTRPVIEERLTVIPRGGLGVGLAAAQVQAAIADALGRHPLILDRPAHADGRVIAVADLVAPAERPFEVPEPAVLDESPHAAWIVSLDAHHLFIGGIGAKAVERAARHYVELIAGSRVGEKHIRSSSESACALEAIPFAGLHVSI